ncbi:MAG: hypothetical protein ACRDTH_27535 [Pseudonocardiaceae bacterium]
MTMCTDETAARSDETYWVDDNAAQPVLLIDEATDSITESLYRARSGSVLADRDVAAARIALGDLFGGLSQLVELLTTSVDQYAEIDPLEVMRLKDLLETLRAMMLSAQHATEGLRLARLSNA